MLRNIPTLRFFPLTLFLVLAAASTVQAAINVLIVADEIPAMEVLAAQLKQRASAQSTIVKQDALPPSLAPFKAVVVYIHKDLHEGAENAFIEYTERGGKLVLLHHSISSGKRANKRWFSFLGVKLPTGTLEQGGYKYFDEATFDLINLAPKDRVTSAKVIYPQKFRDGKGPLRPGFTLAPTEIYLNHVLDGPHTLLLGLQYTEPSTAKIFRQDTAGWQRRAGTGEIYYFMPGHKATDFENPLYAQILANAIVAPRR